MIYKLAKLFKKSKDQKGFTLVELLIVIAIMGVLAAIAIPNFMAFMEDGRSQSDISTAETIETAVTIFQVQERVWPGALSLGGAAVNVNTLTELVPYFLESVEDLEPAQTGKDSFMVHIATGGIVEVTVE